MLPDVTWRDIFVQDLHSTDPTQETRPNVILMQVITASTGQHDLDDTD